jgi:hypothetical protein
MKKFLLGLMIVTLLSSCFIFRKKEKYGCPTNGKNIGAERLLSGDKEAIKAANKAKKFKVKSYPSN